MPGTALIGYTGFVGGTLLRQRAFDFLFNSKNIGEIQGRSFDLVVCAGVSAVKWLANKQPERDLAGIQSLMANLARMTVHHLILISTIDVYRDTAGSNERNVPPTDNLHAYGLHRLQLEAFVRDRFASFSIVRLPALFGTGLKKNALFDMMTNQGAEKIAPNAAYQWYPVRRLTDDLDRICAARIDLINVTSKPLPMETIRARFFPQIEIGSPSSHPPQYDLRTAHAEILGGRDGYHLDATTILNEMSSFLAERQTQQ